MALYKLYLYRLASFFMKAISISDIW